MIEPESDYDPSSCTPSPPQDDQYVLEGKLYHAILWVTDKEYRNSVREIGFPKMPEPADVRRAYEHLGIRRTDSEVPREPSVRGRRLPGVVYERDRAYASTRELESQGMPLTTIGDIESWCSTLGLDSHVVRYAKGLKSSIVYLRGDCFFHRREHERNHWVLINSPAFTTTRVRCHDTGEFASVRRFDF